MSASLSTPSAPMRLNKSDSDEPSRYLYVAGVGHALGTKVETVQKIFSKYGALDLSHSSGLLFENGVYLPDDTRFCFVCFDDVSSCSNAVKELGGPGKTIPIEELNNSRLFIKYAAISLSQGLPEPECVSATDQISVEGVHVVHDFITDDEENSFLSTIGHESGPWLDSMTRRIQHYGVIFNYKTLMLDYSSEAPPIPTIVTPLVERINRKLQDLYQEYPLTDASTRINKNGDIDSINRLNPSLQYSEPIPFSQLTVNEYEPGQGISAHIDTESCLGPDLAIVCMASDATMILQRRGSMSLLARSLYPPLEAVPAVVDGSSAANSATGSITLLDLNDKESYNRFSDDAETTDTSDVSSTTSHQLKKYIWLPRRSLLILRGEARYFWSHAITPRKFDKFNGKLEPRRRRVSLTFRQVMTLGEFPPCRLVPSQIETTFCSRIELDPVSNANKVLSLSTHYDSIHTKQSKDCGAITSIGYIALDKIVVNSHKISSSEVDDSDSSNSINCDIMKTPLLSNSLDSVICVDVLDRISHLDRRSAVLRELVRICKVGGSIVVAARAFEALDFPKQDILIPISSESSLSDGDDVTTTRRQYFHLFKQDEIEDLFTCVPGNRHQNSELITKCGQWLVILTKILDERFTNCVPAPDAAMPTLARLD